MTGSLWGYILLIMSSCNQNSIGEVIKQRRVSLPLTLIELSNSSGVSQSHLARIERGERFPSAHVLQRIAKPLGFDEGDLFILTGFLSGPSSDEDDTSSIHYHSGRVDPLVVQALACETIEVQRAVIGILSIIKSIARTSK